MKKKLILGLLKTVARLPLRALYGVSDLAYVLVYHLVGYRRKVVRKNLTEAFPEKTPQEIKKIERDYYHYMCDVIVETLKLLHISPEEMKRRVRISEYERVNQGVKEGRPAVLLLGHYGNWEWVQEISRVLSPDAFRASIYRPLNSVLWEEIYKQIRSRWKVEIIPQKYAVRKLLRKENQPWICGFIADHRPKSIDGDNIVPFLNHATSFIYGPEVIGTKLGADFFFLEVERPRRGYYNLTFHPIESVEDGKPYPVTRAFWTMFEDVIKNRPAYWLWSHKRWKYDKLLKTK